MITITSPTTNLSLFQIIKKYEKISNNDITEIFKPLIIDGVTTDYKISNLGYVVNSDNHKMKITYINNYGYIFIRHPLTKKQMSLRLNKVVGLNFSLYRGTNINEMEVHHINKNPRDNRYCNLVIVSHDEHIILHKLNGDYQGENNNASKYTNEQIIKLCKLLELDLYTPTALSNITGVSKDMISLIRGGKCWTNISKNYNISPLFTHPDVSDVIIVCEMLEAGYSNKDIAKVVGIKPASISDIRDGRRHKNISKHYDIKPSNRKCMTEQQVHEVCKLFEEGNFDYGYISNKTGVSRDSICRIRIGRIHRKISEKYNFEYTGNNKKKG